MKALSALFPLLASLALSAQDYAIDLGRQGATDLQHHVVVHAVDERRTTTLVGGRAVRTDAGKTTLDLEGEVDVIGKDSANRPRLKVLVTGSSCTVDDKPVDGLPKGLVVIAEYGKEHSVFSRPDGTALDEGLQKYLRMAFTISENMNDDDLAFGTRERKKVGDTWGINQAWAASSLSQQGLRVAPEAISGTVQLKEILKDQGVDCMKVAIAMDIREFSGLPLPPGFRVTKAIFDCQMEGLFPVEVTKDPHQSSEALNGEFLATGKVPTEQGPVEVTIMARMIQKKESRLTPPAGKP